MALSSQTNSIKTIEEDWNELKSVFLDNVFICEDSSNYPQNKQCLAIPLHWTGIKGHQKELSKRVKNYCRDSGLVVTDHPLLDSKVIIFSSKLKNIKKWVMKMIEVNREKGKKRISFYQPDNGDVRLGLISYLKEENFLWTFDIWKGEPVVVVVI